MAKLSPSPSLLYVALTVKPISRYQSTVAFTSGTWIIGTTLSVMGFSSTDSSDLCGPFNETRGGHGVPLRQVVNPEQQSLQGILLRPRWVRHSLDYSRSR